LSFLISILLGLTIGASPALAVEQWRFIQARAEREACYQRQEAELAAKRKPERAADTSTLDALKQMRQEDDAVYQPAQHLPGMLRRLFPGIRSADAAQSIFCTSKANTRTAVIGARASIAALS